MILQIMLKLAGSGNLFTAELICAKASLINVDHSYVRDSTAGAHHLKLEHGTCNFDLSGRTFAILVGSMIMMSSAATSRRLHADLPGT